jgi:hypothetical protein
MYFDLQSGKNVAEEKSFFKLLSFQEIIKGWWLQD